jgi:DNA ligase 1
MTLPTLYKKTSTGAIQFWEIWTEEYSKTAEIRTKYGQLGTGSPQYTVDTISKGKNVGKKNETTPAQQAEAEAKAKYEKQLKKGYVESIEGAEAGETDDLIEGGQLPMLAHSFSKHGDKIKYPAYAQPKLDGIRCVAILKEGECTLWSRTRKQITSMPHIIAAIENMFKKDAALDGELYNHEFRANFEHIVSMVRQEEPDEKHTDVQYHIYDTIRPGSFKERAEWLWENVKKSDFLKLTPTNLVETEDQVLGSFQTFKSCGYEGAIIRNAAGLYVGKRSYDLLKVKEFQDDEFEIVGVEEGRGKLQGHVGAFVCRTTDGKEFLAKMSGDTGNLKKYFEDHSTWIGKQLSVQYQGLTGSNGVPRFPVGIAIRDYE